MGASTWALGSHKCSEYIGILTKKARIHSSHHRWRLVFKGSGGRGRVMFVHALDIIRSVTLNSRGRLAVTVYIIM